MAGKTACAAAAVVLLAVQRAVQAAQQTAAQTAQQPADERINATIAGLQRYYLNATGNYYTCCGQTGGSGGAAPFGCACGRADLANCLHCYRWWATQGLQAFIEAERLGVIERGLVLSTAEAMLAHSPYNKDFGSTMPWVYIDDYAWYVLVFLRMFEWNADERFLHAARTNYDCASPRIRPHSPDAP